MRIIRNISLTALCLLIQGTSFQAFGAERENGEAVRGPGVHGGFGVLVMAHGGSTEWNQGVRESVRPLREFYNLEVAFGMADAVSMQEAVNRLEARGARDIAVVRLFISGESWYGRTRQILGIAEGAPAKPEDAMSAGNDGEGGHRMAFWAIDSEARFHVSREGLAQAREISDVLLARAQEVSRNPEREDVLVLAHGPGDDAENERWLRYMDARAEPLRRAGFYRVRVATLREDWPEKRQAARQAARDFVREAGEADRTALVLPFRVYGFGPYAEVLEGLDYLPNEKGLIPHPAVTRWIVRQAELLRTGNN